jgi:hypothetical protein
VSGTRRVPLDRTAAVQISPRAVDLYLVMSKLKCTCAPPPPEYWKHKMCPGCARWYGLQADLHEELRCEPWQWPCVARQSPKRAGSTLLERGHRRPRGAAQGGRQVAAHIARRGTQCQACRRAHLIGRSISPRSCMTACVDSRSRRRKASQSGPPSEASPYQHGVKRRPALRRLDPCASPMEPRPCRSSTTPILTY